MLVTITCVTAILYMLISLTINIFRLNLELKALRRLK